MKHETVLDKKRFYYMLFFLCSLNQMGTASSAKAKPAKVAPSFNPLIQAKRALMNSVNGNKDKYHDNMQKLVEEFERLPKEHRINKYVTTQQYEAYKKELESHILQGIPGSGEETKAVADRATNQVKNIVNSLGLIGKDIDAFSENPTFKKLKDFYEMQALIKARLNDLSAMLTSKHNADQKRQALDAHKDPSSASSSSSSSSSSASSFPNIARSNGKSNENIVSYHSKEHHEQVSKFIDEYLKKFNMTKKEIQQILASADAISLILMRQGSVGGFVVLTVMSGSGSHDEKTAAITAWAISDKARKDGLGIQLLRKAITQAKTKDVRMIRASEKKANMQDQLLLQELGFKQESTNPDRSFIQYVLDVSRFK